MSKIYDLKKISKVRVERLNSTPRARLSGWLSQKSSVSLKLKFLTKEIMRLFNGITFGIASFFFSGFFFSGSAVAEQPVPIQHVQMNYVDVSIATKVSAAQITKSKLNQLHIEEREKFLVPFFFRYSIPIESNYQFDLWFARHGGKFQAMRPINETLPNALKWAKEWPYTHLDFRWFSMGTGEVDPDILQLIIDQADTFDFYHVGAPGDVQENTVLTQQIQAFEIKHPSKVKFHRVSREVKITITE
jgi:hypothetical protein